MRRSSGVSLAAAVLALHGAATAAFASGPASAVTTAVTGALTTALTTASTPGAGEALARLAARVDGGGSTGLTAILLLTVLSLAPAVLVLVTSFTRIVIVLHFLRTALGLNEVPPTQVLMGLSLFLTWASMGGVWADVRAQAVDPFLEGRLPALEAATQVEPPLRTFMLKQVRKEDLQLMLEVAAAPAPRGPEDLPLGVLVPAFVLNELRVAFQIGLVIFLPFLVVDLVVAVVLASSGLGTLSPGVVALPFKLLLFVLIDGWSLVVGSLLKTVAQ